MKQEKHWYGSKQIPEKEWEGKYLVSMESESTNNSLAFNVFLASVLAMLIIFSIFVFTAPCEIEASGEFAGNISAKIANSSLEKFQVNQANGSIKIVAPCYLIKTFGG